jgi:hypothetical protein
MLYTMLKGKISTMEKPCYKCANFYKDKCILFYKLTYNKFTNPRESANSNISLLVEPEIASKVWNTKCGPNGKYFVNKD